jgi:hypothetical protein
MRRKARPRRKRARTHEASFLCVKIAMQCINNIRKHDVECDPTMHRYQEQYQETRFVSQQTGGLVGGQYRSTCLTSLLVRLLCVHSRPGSRAPPVRRMVSPFTYAHSMIHLTVCANSSACPNLRPVSTPAPIPTESPHAPLGEDELALEAAHGLRGHARDHGRLEGRRRDGHDAHAVPREVARERERHARERALRRRVRGLPRLALELGPR